MKTLTKNTQANITPDTAVELLEKGNQRFLENLRFNRNLLQQVNETADGQFPFAVILSCIDSRTPAEIIFDQGLGDIFSIRIAGNIINDDILGSMEFACKVAGSKLIMVLGHTGCGAIKGACDNVELENLTGLLKKIKPAIQDVSSEKTIDSNDSEDFVKKVTVANVHKSIKSITSKSQTLSEMADNGSIKIIGGMYDISSGRVEFFEEEKP